MARLLRLGRRNANPPGESPLRERSAVILVADCEANFVIALRAQLERQGYCTRWARDGLEALRLIEENRFDLALVEVRLPAIDGLQVLEVVRRRRRFLPVIVMTTHDRPELKSRAASLGAYACLIKPFDIGKLGPLVERAMRARRAGSSHPLPDQPALRRALRAGKAVSLRLAGGEFSGDYPSQVVTRRGESLAVTAPRVGGVPLPLALGTPVTVGLTAAGGAVEFFARVVARSFEGTEPQLVLRCPAAGPVEARRR